MTTSRKYFTADTHFFHNRIIGFQETRKCFMIPDEIRVSDDKGEVSTEKEIALMNEEITDNWNSVVRPEDHIWHIGDVTFGNSDANSKLFGKLNGKKHLVPGNHDPKRMQGPKAKAIFEAGFVEITPVYTEIEIDGVRVCLMHHPMRCWPGADHGSIHLHGHLHGNVNNDHRTHVEKYRTLDVGIDAHPDFRPFSWEDEIYGMMKDREYLRRYGDS